MKTYKEVKELIAGWKNSGISKSDIVVNAANACIGWPYVYGGRGEECTPSRRGSRADAKYPNIVDKCQVLRKDRSNCNGCPFYPNGVVLFFDCRGLTYWLMSQVGIKIAGAGATTQYKTDSNWSEKGPIKDMPRDKVCCVFRYDKDTGKMEHTLLYDGKGNYIHCSGEVKKVATSKYNATHYAIPKGLNEGGSKPMPEPTSRTTAVVYAENEKPVKMRAKPSTSCKTYWELQCGTEVDVIEKGAEWSKITDGRNTGYMMSKFLSMGDVGDNQETEIPGEQPLPDDDYTLCIPDLTKDRVAELMKLYPNAYIVVG